ncbi:copper homeostasis protein CutC [Nocardioides anomalus]|uniref:Copper homeostasis protein CutC n=1 Tax=Nocardioides anomalus TaxID=2712223 RepID=A0A6G6WGU2_9ACTN|nr:copper homeostasis protein CutC [Nocardioides anomalus]QIG44454.1 copper homeostasis protein CutC [Nocardioides anomalus]
MGVVLEVAVAHERDVAGALEGGADRLHVATPAGEPLEPVVVSAVCREAGAVPVFAAVTRAEQVPVLRELGVAGVSVGFLDADLEVDVEACAALGDVAWQYVALDHALDPRRSWRRLAGPPALPGLVGVRSAGSPRGMSEGYDDLQAAADADPAVAALLVPGDGLLAEHVPWLVRAGVRAFHVDLQARPSGSWKAYVAPDLVRSWRLLLDGALERL